ncbi:MAG: HEAT repeat domain-containing protein, partial [Abditibacteriales bacterium]|nr:HEAT repeat domain-containing protein [Abditibacteriales bacterium]MDW8365424.1 HEAT repeat domain-containing protein [Abditibacteriales bacterium]
MARKRKKPSLPTTPEGLIDALLNELRKEEPNEPFLDAVRTALLDLGEGYVPALMDKIRRSTDEPESALLSLLIHLMGDPRLIEPLRAIAMDPDNTLSARVTACVGLKAYGINVRLDVAPSRGTSAEEALSEEEAAQALDQVVDAIAQAQQSREGLESLVSLLAIADPRMIQMLLLRAVERYGKSVAAALSYLAHSSELETALAAVRALAHLRHPVAVRALQQVVDQSPHSEVSREARRAIFELCEQGVTDVGAEEEQAAAPVQPWRIERALLSNVDGIGSRLMFLHCALPDGKAAWVQVYLNDVVGLRDCAGKECAPKEVEDNFQFLLKMSGSEIEDENGHSDSLLLVEADPHYCHYLIAEARQKNQRSHFPLPIGYHAWLAPLGEPPVHYAQPLIYALIDVDSVEDVERLIEESDLLLEEPQMRSWLFRFDDIRPFAERAKEESRQLVGLPFGMWSILAGDTLEEAVTTL